MYQTNPAGAITELRVELVKQLDSVDDKVDGLDQKLDTALAEQSVNRIRIKALEDASARTDHKLERLEDRLTDLGDQIHKSGERKK